MEYEILCKYFNNTENIGKINSWVKLKFSPLPKHHHIGEAPYRTECNELHILVDSRVI